MIYHIAYGVGRARTEHWTKTWSIHTSGRPEGVKQRHKSRGICACSCRSGGIMRMRRGAIRSTFHARALSARAHPTISALVPSAQTLRVPESSPFERARAQDVRLDDLREPGAKIVISQRRQGLLGWGGDLWAGPKDSGEDHL